MIRFGGVVALCSVAAFSAPALFTTVAPHVLPALNQAANCKIKGNISINTGERIYHMPGQLHYLETKISPDYGERWFCTEREAQAAGWRKSRS